MDGENALGWNDDGRTGTMEERFAYIEQVWTDMQPLRLRQKMQAESASEDGRHGKGGGS